MALVRVYCGVATAELAPWLTVAVVDDSGRLLDVRHISDDPAGYAYLVALLADRSAGACPVAVDRHEHIVAQLLAAAARPLAIADEMRMGDFADRFADESAYDETQAPPSQRRAVGLARALQAGALYATAQSPSWDLDELKPVLSAHAALVAGRQASAVTLREVLRELYPAALRAYLDPAELIPLRVLEVFPEPGLLLGAADIPAIIAEIAASGLTDAATASTAVTALGVAVEELRERNNPQLAPAVAEAVRQAVASVRACDAAANVLVASLVERLNAGLAIAPAHVPTSPAPVSPAVPRPAQPVEMAAGWAAAAPAPAFETVGAHASGRPNGHAYDSDAPVPSRGRASVATPGAAYRPGGWEEQFGPAPTSPAPRSYGPDTLSFSMDPLTAPLDAPRPAQTVPAGDDLLIFSQANSVWFTNADDDTQVTWTNLSSDDGWRAAGSSAEPSVGPDTTAGLPRRMPAANLVPGSARAPARPPRVVRDPRRLADHTEGFFRGWRRGQQTGGYGAGQRGESPSWEFNREQRTRQGAARLS